MKHQTNRSEDRIPNLRTRGRANRRKLLCAAERLLAERHGGPLRFSDVFESAGVSRGSAYRIYIGIDDLMQDLATEWITNAVAYLSDVRMEQTPQTWQQLSDFIIETGRDYWADTAETLRVMPRLRSNAPESYKSAVREFSHCLAALFDSAGIVSFYFRTKEALLLATLEHLDLEFENRRLEVLDRAGDDPVRQLEAIIDVNLDPALCDAERVAVWVAFWGESQARESYQRVCGARDVSDIWGRGGGSRASRGHGRCRGASLPVQV